MRQIAPGDDNLELMLGPCTQIIGGVRNSKNAKDSYLLLDVRMSNLQAVRVWRPAARLATVSASLRPHQRRSGKLGKIRV